MFINDSINIRNLIHSNPMFVIISVTSGKSINFAITIVVYLHVPKL
jgi:hypothetical protein